MIISRLTSFSRLLDLLEISYKMSEEHSYALGA